MPAACVWGLIWVASLVLRRISQYIASVTKVWVLYYPSHRLHQLHHQKKNIIEDTKNSRRNMAYFPLHCLQEDQFEYALCTTYVPVNFRFHKAIIFSYRFACCKDHIYDNSTLMEIDLSLLPVFWGTLRVSGIVSTLARAHP